MKRHLSLIGAAALILAAAAPGAANDPLPGIKRIVFLGDSITYGGHYVTDFACWLAAREKPIEVLNLGLPSETAADLTDAEQQPHVTAHKFPRPELRERLSRVLEAAKPDLLVVCYGMNDGCYEPLNPERFGRFREGLLAVRQEAAKAGTRRIIHLTPPVYDAAGQKGREPAYDETLKQYGHWLLSKRAEGWEVADTHGPMRQALDRRRQSEPGFAFARDGVHPGREGHWLMARELIRLLGDESAAKAAAAEELFAQPVEGAAIRALLHQRMEILRDAWLTRTGHNRPGLKKGLPLEEAQAKANELTRQMQALLKPAFPGKISFWNGYLRHDFEVGEGKLCSVIAPATPLPGRLWAWKGEFLDAFPATEIELLKKGVHIVYLRIPNLLGAPEAVRHWNAAYQELTTRHGLAPRPALIGLSRGGLYCYNWAAANPQKVACLYGDAPVCDLKSWPGGKGRGKGSAGDWKLAMQVYGFKSEADALAFKGNPVDTLEPLAKAGIPLIHVYGEADDVVPWEENTGLLAERYRKLGGSIELIGKPGVGHHPHGLKDPAPVVDFILRQLRKANANAQ